MRFRSLGTIFGRPGRRGRDRHAEHREDPEPRQHEEEQAEGEDLEDKLEELNGQIEDKTIALQRFEDQVVAADVFLKDINGPKGGIDKQVLVRVRLRNRQVIATEIARTRLRAAVVVSVRMAKRAVRRSVKKSLQKHRWRAQPSLREVTES